MTFQEKIKSKLADYKSDRFHTLPNGIYKKDNKQYFHILPEIDWKMNLLPTYRNDVLCYISSCLLKLHTNTHHLNSSQVMCFNFFYPLLKVKKLELILNFLGFKEYIVNYNSACFEKDGLEKVYNETPTSFDFYFETTNKKKFYFEIKYTESDFGKAEHNSSHKAKFQKVYSNHLSAIQKSFQTESEFLNNYQLLRNLVHIDDNSYVVFLYPFENQKIRQTAEDVRKSVLIDNYKNHFFPVTWEDLFNFVYKFHLNAELQEQFSEFKIKYL